MDMKTCCNVPLLRITDAIQLTLVTWSLGMFVFVPPRRRMQTRDEDLVSVVAGVFDERGALTAHLGARLLKRLRLLGRRLKDELEEFGADVPIEFVGDIVEKNIRRRDGFERLPVYNVVLLLNADRPALVECFSSRQGYLSLRRGFLAHPVVALVLKLLGEFGSALLGYLAVKHHYDAVGFDVVEYALVVGD